jgi:ABC-2 type transport system ATP-binding protein
MSATPILEFRDVARSFRRAESVLSGVSFTVGSEEVVALLGRNGAGKSTLIQIAMGLLYPHAGSVRVFGLDPIKRPVAVKKRVGYVAEDQLLPPKSTIAEVIAFHRYLFSSWDLSLEKHLLERFELGSMKTRISQLSKGQAQQTALLCAVCHRPELLILDEPAGGLDPSARREFLETAIQLLNREGTSILFSSHYMGDVERLGGRVVLLDDGKIRIDRELDALRESHCLAIIPRQSVPLASTIESVPGCLKLRAEYGEWRAIFSGTPQEVHDRLQQSLGIENVRCVTIALEELFVEMVSGTRLAVAS